MKKSKLKRFLSLILIAAMIMIAATACGKKDADQGTANADSKEFTFVVVDKEGAESTFQIKTNRTKVSEALLDENLIEGSEGAYGLYITKVNGIEAIYENDGTYWAFYVNGEYGMTGVEMTDIENGATYMFKAEK